MTELDGKLNRKNVITDDEYIGNLGNMNFTNH